MLQKSPAIARIAVMNTIAQSGLDLFDSSYIVKKDIENPDALIVRSAKIDTDALGPNLLAIARAGIGVNTITVEKATAAGICVFNTPGGNRQAVAEIVMTGIGAQLRRMFDAVQFMRSLAPFAANRLDAFIEANKAKFVGREIEGLTLGVIGLGKIGVPVANLGLKKGMKVIGYDAFLTLPNMHELDREVTIAKTMDQVIENADVITVHVPLSSDTKHLIGAPQIARMRTGVMLLNYSRGGIYDDQAVIEALASGKVDSYLTDFATGELCANPRVIPTPHLAASTAESEEKCALMAAKQLKDFLETGTVVNSVNFPTVELPVSREVMSRLVVVNRDVPGAIAGVTSILSENGINISGSINQGNGKIGYNLIDTSSDIPPEIIAKIVQIENILKVRAIPLNR